MNKWSSQSTHFLKPRDMAKNKSWPEDRTSKPGRMYREGADSNSPRERPSVRWPGCRLELRRQDTRSSARLCWGRRAELRSTRPDCLQSCVDRAHRFTSSLHLLVFYMDWKANWRREGCVSVHDWGWTKRRRRFRATVWKKKLNKHRTIQYRELLLKYFRNKLCSIPRSFRAIPQNGSWRMVLYWVSYGVDSNRVRLLEYYT